MSPDKPSRAHGIFNEPQHAVQAVHALVKAGFAPSSVVVISHGWRGPALPGPQIDLQNVATRGAIKGALAGGIFGVAVGLLLSLIPRIAFSVFVLVALCGAAGAAIGAYFGPFIALRLAEAGLYQHARVVRQGRTVVVVRAAERLDEALAIMIDHGAYDSSMATQP